MRDGASIAKADITPVIHEEPAFAELFIAHLLARNSRVEADLVDQLFNSSEKRLARVCAVTRRRFPVGANPTRRPLQPEATGAAMEVTK
jgi:hypothetical protein